MGNPVYEQMQTRKVKARLCMLQHARRPTAMWNGVTKRIRRSFIEEGRSKTRRISVERSNCEKHGTTRIGQHLALKGRTPADCVRQLAPQPNPAKDPR